MKRLMPAQINVWSPIASLVLAFGILGVSPTINPVSAQEQPRRIMSVRGEGIVSVPTTLSEVRLGVEVQGNTVEEAQREVARRAQRVVELLRSRNVENLETTRIELNPVYSNTPNQARTITGYIATNIVSFRLPTERVGNLLGEAVKAGATRIEGINFIPTDEAIQQGREQAIRAATEDALFQADIALSSANLTRREIVKMQVSASRPPTQRQRQLYERNSDISFIDTPVIGGESDISASVSLEISY